MGTFGYGIFDDDLSMDIRNFYEDYMDEGLSSEEAVMKIIGMFETLIDKGGNEAIILYLVLASLQLDNGTVNPEIRDKVLYIIEHDLGIDHFKRIDQKRRKKEYSELRDKLLLK